MYCNFFRVIENDYWGIELRVSDISRGKEMWSETPPSEEHHTLLVHLGDTCCDSRRSLNSKWSRFFLRFCGEKWRVSTAQRAPSSYLHQVNLASSHRQPTGLAPNLAQRHENCQPSTPPAAYLANWSAVPNHIVPPPASSNHLPPMTQLPSVPTSNHQHSSSTNHWTATHR